MKPNGNFRIVIMTILIVLSCGTADAQRRHRYHHPHHVVTVVTTPTVAVHLDNRFTQKERFRMAMTYLKSHEYLTVKRYAKMTGMPKATAKAELDAFSDDKDKPIVAVIRGKKRVYTLRNRS